MPLQAFECTERILSCFDYSYMTEAVRRKIFILVDNLLKRK